jgi:hypothetical protein
MLLSSYKVLETELKDSNALEEPLSVSLYLKRGGIY